MATAFLTLVSVTLALVALVHGYPIQKGRIFSRDVSRTRDCPRGFDILGTFDPYPSLDTCLGVASPFFIFKVTIFGPELETSALIRATSAFKTVTWNAWAHYHATAVDTLGKLSTAPARRRPTAEHTIRNRNIAIIYALGGVVAEVLPRAANETARIMQSLQLDPANKSLNMSSPIGIGNRVAAEMVAWLRTDGWNSMAIRSPHTYPNTPMADYVGYRPVNTPWEIKDPFRWQPMLEHDTAGTITMQTHTTPQAGYNTKAFAMTREEVVAAKIPSPWADRSMPRLMEAMLDAINVSASLDDRKKMLTELFDNKALVVGGLELYMAKKHGWCHDDWVSFDMLGAAVYDSTILAWKEKIRHDAVRPLTAIRSLLANETFQAWGGPGKGTQTIYGDQFQAYMRTMPHSEYPSGSTCVCTVIAEWGRLATQPANDTLDLDLTFGQGCSAVEPYHTPATDFGFKLGTWQQLLEECSNTRRWAGVHFQPSLAGAQALCTGVAAKTYERITKLKAGIYTTPN